MIRIIMSAINLPLVDNQLTFALHIFNTTDDRFHPQAGHIRDLLPRQLDLLAFTADILPGFLKIMEQGGNPVFRGKAGQFFEQ